MDRVITHLAAAITAATGQTPVSIRLLGGGLCDVYGVRLTDGTMIVAKRDNRAAPQLDVEAKMLDCLSRLSSLPVPAVIHSSTDLLLMPFIEGGGNLTAAAEEHAADLLAGLHAVTAPAFGFDYDTLIGGLRQPNRRNTSWIDFFRDERLLSMGRTAVQSNRLPTLVFMRLERLAESLNQFLTEPKSASLIHGDVWSGNVIVGKNKIAAFIDPAIYYADPEIELAFIGLFHTFSARFLRRYAEHRPIAEGFTETRAHIYNLYPLLVHVQLFGGSYVQTVGDTLKRFGF
ncbi:MAG: fructosamine kinase family protein [Rhizobacter sp.]|nr:fructosamine kinase family protein [Chlorobiales bacterium]